MRTLTEADVEFTLECLPEETPIKGNALASGNDVEDRKQERWIERELRSGNQWAWCTVRVTAKWEGFEGTDYLGCCSYTDADDFRTPGGYFDDMKAEALDALNTAVAESHAKTSKLA